MRCWLAFCWMCLHQCDRPINQWMDSSKGKKSLGSNLSSRWWSDLHGKMDQTKIVCLLWLLALQMTYRWLIWYQLFRISLSLKELRKQNIYRILDHYPIGREFIKSFKNYGIMEHHIFINGSAWGCWLIPLSKNNL